MIIDHRNCQTAETQIDGSVILRYSDNGVPAAVAYDPKGYRAVSFGFPLEVLKDADVLETLLHRSVEYISDKK